MIDDDEPIIGIDLGTTNCCVSVLKLNNPIIVPNDFGKRVTPSYVSYTQKQILVGESAKKNMLKYTKNTLYDSKRLIGRKYKDKVIQNDLKNWDFQLEEDKNTKKPVYVVQINNKINKYFPEEISARILQKLKKISSDYLGKEVKKAVITVPAYFNNEQREATKKAGEIAGFENIRIINEPTAAAIAYGLENFSEEERKVLVFDLGGGTFDVSILKIKGKKFEVLTSCGDSHLGGEDFTIRLTEYLLNQFNEENNTNIDFSDKSNEKIRNAYNKMKNLAEDAKKNLSSDMIETPVNIDSLYDGIDFDYYLTRGEFENICEDLFSKCIFILDKIIKNISLNKNDIDNIVLAGGSSRIPKIHELLEKYFNKKKIFKTINADEAISIGAVLVGYNEDKFEELSLKNKCEIYDIINYSIGIEDHEGKMVTIIPKNDPLPERGTTKKYFKFFRPQNDYAKGYIVKLFEGENEYVKNNNELGEFSVIGIKPEKKEDIIIKIQIEINHDSIVKIIAFTNDKVSKKIIIEKNNEYDKEDLKRFNLHAEEYEEREEDRRNIVKLLDMLKNINNDIKQNLRKCKSFNQKDYKEIHSNYQEISKWIRENPEPEKIEIERKIQKALTLKEKFINKNI